jgi:hypothetical protein
MYQSWRLAVPLNRHSRDEVLKRRAQVSEAYLSGQTQSAIAARLGVSQQQISSDLAVLRTEWRSSALVNMDEAKRTELAKIDLVESSAWAGWARSIGKHRVVREEVDSTGKRRHIVTVENLAGAPRFLGIVNQCIEARTKLLGLYAPLETRITGKLSIDDIRQILQDGGELDDEAAVH